MYAMDIDYYSNNQVEDFIEDKYTDKCYFQSTEEVGFMYKAHGSSCNGPWGPSSEQYLNNLTCGATIYDSQERVALSYDQETDTFYDLHDNIYDIIYGLNKQGLSFSEGDPASRQWFYNNFDVNEMLNYIVLVNWAGAWDDLIGNHNLYQRLTDGKWTMVPWDMDSYFGKQPPCLIANCSIYNGEQGQPVGQYQSPGGFNTLKDHFIKCFRNELKQRYVIMAKTILSINNTLSIFDEAYEKINITEYDLAPCTPNSYDVTCNDTMASWHIARNEHVLQYLSNVSVDPSLYNTITLKPALSILCPGKPNATIVNQNWKSAPGRPYPPFQVSNGSISMTIQWYGANPNGNYISQYILWRSRNDQAYEVVYQGASLTYSDSSLTSDSNYTYIVQAENSAGTSPLSDISDVYSTSFVPTAGTTSFLTTNWEEILEESGSSHLMISLHVFFFILALFV